ncbi:MAG TPA: PIG-L family deacetylase [Candidatus Acidoferrales bacterium]|jgi:LmbE family N-acetylglucosaminyl deacetylase|nr:PIG-L family deacetylase [Candidatus Acidoferrales bacterium]
MKRRQKFRLLSLSAAICALTLVLARASAQQEPAAPGRGKSVADTLESIQKARVVTRVLFTVAHPDDEASTLLTYLPHALGTDTTLLTLNRGEGGQNAIGPEQGAQLGILRSSELLAAMNVEGPHLYFTRVIDFGFSKTLEETLEKWHGVELEDMVRVIRMLRPQVVVNGWGGQKTGHGHHQDSGYQTPKAVEAAADPTKYPDQIAEGLKPWRAEMILDPVRATTQDEKVDYTGSWVVPADEISPIWGLSYRDIALEGYLHHRSQGVTPFLNAPFVRRPYGLKRTTGGPPTPSDFAQPLLSLASVLPVPSQDALATADHDLDQARAAAEKLDWTGAVRCIAEAGKQIMTLENQVKHSQDSSAAGGLWELEQVRARIDHALADAAAIKIVSNADRSELVAGEGFSVRAEVAHRNGLAATFSKPELALPPGWSITKQEEKEGSTNFNVAVPAGAQTPHTPGDFLDPFPSPLVSAHTHVEADGYAFDFTAPVQSLHATTVSVLSYPLRIVPPVGLTPEPEQYVLVESRQPKQFDVFARVHSFAQTPSKVSVGVEVPSGWIAPAPEVVEFSGVGDRLVHMTVAPPAKIVAGNYELKTYAKRGGETFETSLEPLPSLPTYLWSASATVPVHVFSIAVPEHLRVGYIAAENDAIPDSLRRLGVDVDMLDANALAFGDLSRFDAIVVGMRAYELRSDVVASNSRLLDYAAGGGTLVVLDQRPAIWDALKPSPFPATMGPGPRVTDENAAVNSTDPASPLLNFPNKIEAHDFDGWVQERGLYFWEKWDAKYHTVLSMHDPGEKDVTGSLVWTSTGKGVYIYTGLSFSRQLPEGNAGAFRLFVNLLSQSRARSK